MTVFLTHKTSVVSLRVKVITWAGLGEQSPVLPRKPRRGARVVALAPPPALQAEEVQNGAALGHRVGGLNCQRLYLRAELTASLGAPGAPPLEDTGSERRVEPWV